jgi:CRP/FNR family transcriptional regulator, nitrogen oxide reductase regulator
MNKTPKVLKQERADVRAGDHILSVYEGVTDLASFVVPFIAQGQARGDQILYVTDDLRLSEVTQALAAGGVDVNREIERGHMGFLTAQEWYGLPRFDATSEDGILRVIDLFRRRVREAAARRFAGLCVAVEMTWALKAGIPEDTVVALEDLYDEAAAGIGNLTAACMYRRGRFAPATLRRMLRNHRKVAAGNLVHVSLNPMFENLAETDQRALLRSSRERRVPKGGFFFNQGDEAREVFLLTRGKVKLVRTDRDGRNTILDLEAPTEIFGERAAFARTPLLASAQALEDSCALVWDVSTILEAMMCHPSIALNVARMMAEQVEGALARIEDLASVRVELRLARLLRLLAQTMGRPTPQGIVVEVPISGQELAEMIGTTPYSVSRLLAGWRRLGIVDAQRDQILILQLHRLTGLGGGLDGQEGATPAANGNPSPES